MVSLYHNPDAAAPNHHASLMLHTEPYFSSVHLDHSSHMASTFEQNPSVAAAVVAVNAEEHDPVSQTNKPVPEQLLSVEEIA